jgi:hypothetical protein
MKPTEPQYEVQAAAWAEIAKLVEVRRPPITYLYDAFEAPRH